MMNNKVSDHLSKVVFWDADATKLNWETHAHYIISKVVQYGTMDDWRVIQKHYGLARIKKEVLQIRFMDVKTLSFLSVFFKIPKEKFRCYKQKQSIPKHWNF